MTIGTLIYKGEIKISDTCKYISDMKENNTTNNYKIRALITIEVEQWTFCYTVFITQFFQKNPPNPLIITKPLEPCCCSEDPPPCTWSELPICVSLASPESCGEPCAGFVWSRTPYWHPPYPHLPLSVSSHTAAFTLALSVVIAYCHWLCVVLPSFSRPSITSPSSVRLPCLLRLLFRFIRAEETQF